MPAPEHETASRLANEELPEGWEVVPFLDVIDYQGGAQPPKKVFIYEPRNEYVRLLQIRDFGENPFPTYVPDSGRLKKVNEDDLLLARYGGGAGDDCLGRICTGLAGAYNVAMVKLLFARELLIPGFVKCYFEGPWFRIAISVNSRSCQHGFNKGDLRGLIFPLPPLAEQKRIVAAVERLFEQLRGVRERLEKVPVILKRFRQSVLAAACSGRLTEDWREGGIRSGYCVSSPDGLPELPAPWSWSTVEEVATIRSGKRLPKGSSLVDCDTGFPYIRAGNLKQGTVQGKILYLRPEDREKIRRYTVNAGDVYITIVGACIGDAGVVPEHREGANLTENAAKMCDFRSIESRYLALVLRSPLLQDIISGKIFSGSQGKLALRRIAALPVPLPPIEEQQRIVRRVEALFQLADDIEARVAAATARADKLQQAILAKAFRGELVPTEATLALEEGRTYEPASKLLDRIKEREDGSRHDKRGRRTRK